MKHVGPKLPYLNLAVVQADVVEFPHRFLGAPDILPRPVAVDVHEHERRDLFLPNEVRVIHPVARELDVGGQVFDGPGTREDFFCACSPLLQTALSAGNISTILRFILLKGHITE